MAAKERGGKKARPTARRDAAPLRFESTQIDSLFPVLDAVAWMQIPDVGQIAQFAGIDARTAGKLLKNSQFIGLVECIDGTGYLLSVAYPYKGSPEQKRAVVREALVNLPLLASVRQFLSLGDSLEVSLRKAATITGVRGLDPSNLTPLVKWAKQLEALTPGLVHDDLLESAEAAKQQRHKVDKAKTVAFLSHSTVDKPLIRQLATDLTASGISVWLDEQKIKVGDSIPEQIASGLAESDFFVVAISRQSSNSEWVKHELNSALMSAISDRRVKVLPVKLDDVEMPALLRSTAYADFSKSYKEGLRSLLQAMKEKPDGEK